MAQPGAVEPVQRAHDEEEQSALERGPGSGHEAALDLSTTEQEEVERRSSLRVVVVHEAIRIEGEEELSRPVSALAWSGLAAGLSMGFSLVTEGLLRAALPDAPWRPLLTKLGYPVGFLLVILGRQQLFTENTLTVILPLLTRRNLSTLLAVIRLWAVVLAANLAGAVLFAAVIAHSYAFDAPARQAFAQIGIEAYAGGFLTHLIRAIFAGWLIALMVWCLPAAGSSRVAVIVVVTYVVGLARLSHIIAGATEVLYLAVTGTLGPTDFLLHYFTPTLLGNTLGGVSLVAALNHAQVVAGKNMEAAASPSQPR